MTGLPESPSEILLRLLTEKNARPDCGKYLEPEGQAEAALSEIWSEVLRIDRIGRNDNLFDLGGDSLHIVLISSRIQKRFGVEIAIDEFFDEPTIAHLATLVEPVA